MLAAPKKHASGVRVRSEWDEGVAVSTRVRPLLALHTMLRAGP